MSYVDLTDIIKDQIPPAERHTGYLVDLSTVQLEDIEGSENSSSWVHALSVGEYKHPLWGKLKFPASRIQRFADNLNNRIRGIDPAIDYGHFSSGEAAGWVQSGEARANGLWIFVEWTKAAAEKIRNKEYRYFSSDFADEWEDPETGTTYEDVLLGGGLTNRPFLKNLVPVNLSELYGKEKEKEEDDSMELTEQLRSALGLSDDATEQDALEAIQKLQIPKVEDPPSAPDVPVELSENPVVKRLMEEVAELRSERTLAEAQRLTESWTTHSTKKFALPPAVSDNLTELLVGGSKQFVDKLTEVVDAILTAGLINLSESGGTRKGENTTDDPIAEFNKRVKELQDTSPDMSFADAYSEASRDEKLFDQYRRASLAGTISDIEGGDS